jgi:hypothetical protein
VTFVAGVTPAPRIGESIEIVPFAIAVTLRVVPDISPVKVVGLTVIHLLLLLQKAHPVLFAQVAQSVIVVQSTAGQVLDVVMNVVFKHVVPDGTIGLFVIASLVRHFLASGHHPHFAFPAQSLQDVMFPHSTSEHFPAIVINVACRHDFPRSLTHFGTIALA